jgi:hypothetical protein
MNHDPKNATEVPGATLFDNALKNLADQECTPSVNKNVLRAFAQYWTETTYPDESNYDLINRDIPGYEFRTIYRDVLSNLKEAERVIATEIINAEDPNSIRSNRLAVCEILTVYAYQREVDIFGNVPYSQALDINQPSPQYDDAQSIYGALFSRLDAAVSTINEGADGFGADDLIYGGNMTMWKRLPIL